MRNALGAWPRGGAKYKQQTQKVSSDNPGGVIWQDGVQGVARAQRRGELRQIDAVRAGLRKATRLEGVAPTGWAWSWGVTRGPRG